MVNFSLSCCFMIFVLLLIGLYIEKGYKCSKKTTVLLVGQIARFLWSCSVIHIMCVTWLERNRRVYGDYTGRKFKSLGHNFWSLDI